MKSKALEIVTICGFFFSARKGGNYVRNQIFIKGKKMISYLKKEKNHLIFMNIAKSSN